MADHEHGLSPLNVLKKMSLKRQELEHSARDIKRSLERMHQKNEAEEQHVNSSVTELHRQQHNTKQLLVSDSPGKQRSERSQGHEFTESSDESSERMGTTGRRGSPDPVQVVNWTTSDVIEWLESRHLHKFILLCQRHHVLGKDLVDIRLPFLDEQDHITAEEKEQLLGELYKLINPPSVGISHEALDRIISPVDRDKYFAAVRLATECGSAVDQSASMLELATTQSSTPSPLSVDAAPGSNQRAKSESSYVTDNSSKLLPPPKYKRRKSPLHASIKEHDIDESDSKVSSQHKIRSTNVGSSLYETMKDCSSQHLECMQVNRQQDGFGLTLGKDNNGCFVVDSVEDDLAVPVFVGDRVLEMNGILTLQSTEILNNQVDEMSQKSKSLQLVLSRDSSTKVKSRTNGMSDWKWGRLREVLVEMRDKDGDQRELLKYLSPDQLHDLDLSLVTGKDRNENFQKMLRKETIKGTNDGESQNYTVTLEKLNLDTATKEDVVASLKEIVKGASRQKWYLDRLISLVIEEAPWILEQIDSDLDNLNMHQPDEFC